MKHSLSCRKWFGRFFIIFVTPTLAVVLFNLLFDPLLCFSPIHFLNERAEIIDERQQKTNLLTFGPRNFSNLVIGSSRTELIRPKDIMNGNTFNYAAPAMRADEYAGYIAYFRKTNRTKLDNVYIGLDFFATNRKGPISNDTPESYFDRTGQTLYRFKTTLNFDTVRAYLKKRRDTAYYFQFDRREGVTVFRKGVKYDMSKLLKERHELFRKHFYSSDKYEYDIAFKKTCETIRSRNPDVRLVAFTTPVSKPLFETLVLEGRFEDYCRWIREAVAAFGGIYNFMYLNDVTNNQSNFMDADHLFTASAALVAHKITGVADPRIPSDFGAYITDANLEQHLTDIRRQAEGIMAQQSNQKLDLKPISPKQQTKEHL